MAQPTNPAAEPRAPESPGRRQQLPADEEQKLSAPPQQQERPGSLRRGSGGIMGPGAGATSDSTKQQPPRILETSPRGRFARFEDLLGEGSYKRVFRAYDSQEGVDVAWNEFRVGGQEDPAAGARALREMKILQTLDHPRILRFVAAWLDARAEKAVFVTELVSGGTLRGFIQDRPVRLCILKRWCRELLGALAYLHGHSPPIVHRDLKCENVFIDGARGHLRIGDLGLASWRRGASVARASLGTPGYMAPEMFEDDYDEQVDVHAFGMCALEMACKQRPFAECASVMHVVRSVVDGKRPAAFERLRPECGLRAFVLACITRAPPRRPSAQALLEADFLAPQPGDDAVDCLDLLLPAGASAPPEGPPQARSQFQPQSQSQSQPEPQPQPSEAQQQPAPRTRATPQSAASVTELLPPPPPVVSAPAPAPQPLSAPAPPPPARPPAERVQSLPLPAHAVELRARVCGASVRIAFDLAPSDSPAETVREMLREGCLPAGASAAELAADTEQLQAIQTQRARAASADRPAAGAGSSARPCAQLRRQDSAGSASSAPARGGSGVRGGDPCSLAAPPQQQRPASQQLRPVQQQAAQRGQPLDGADADDPAATARQALREAAAQRLAERRAEARGRLSAEAAALERKLLGDV